MSSAAEGNIVNFDATRTENDERPRKKVKFAEHVSETPVEGDVKTDIVTEVDKKIKKRLAKPKTVLPGIDPEDVEEFAFQRQDQGPVKDVDPNHAAKRRAAVRAEYKRRNAVMDVSIIPSDIAAAEEDYEEPEERFLSGDIPVEPFHLRREREDGYFDAFGNYIEFRSDSNARDAWLDSLNEMAPGQRVEGELAERLLHEVRRQESSRQQHQQQSSSQPGKPSTSINTNQGVNRKARWANRRSHTDTDNAASEDFEEYDEDEDDDTDEYDDEMLGDDDDDGDGTGPAKLDEDDILSYKQRVVALLQVDDESVLQALRRLGAREDGSATDNRHDSTAARQRALKQRKKLQQEQEGPHQGQPVQGTVITDIDVDTSSPGLRNTAAGDKQAIHATIAERAMNTTASAEAQVTAQQSNTNAQHGDDDVVMEGSQPLRQAKAQARTSTRQAGPRTASTDRWQWTEHDKERVRDALQRDRSRVTAAQDIAGTVGDTMNVAPKAEMPPTSEVTATVSARAACDTSPSKTRSADTGRAPGTPAAVAATASGPGSASKPSSGPGSSSSRKHAGRLQNSVDFEKLTDYADLLLGAGDFGIYTKTRRVLQREVDNARSKTAAKGAKSGNTSAPARTVGNNSITQAVLQAAGQRPPSQAANALIGEESRQTLQQTGPERDSNHTPATSAISISAPGVDTIHAAIQAAAQDVMAGGHAIDLAATLLSVAATQASVGAGSNRVYAVPAADAGNMHQEGKQQGAMQVDDEEDIFADDDTPVTSTRPATNTSNVMSVGALSQAAAVSTNGLQGGTSRALPGTAVPGNTDTASAASTRTAAVLAPAAEEEDRTRHQGEEADELSQVLDGFALDVDTGLYYNSTMGLWYNSHSQLFMDANTGVWYRIGSGQYYEEVPEAGRGLTQQQVPGTGTEMATTAAV